MTEIQQAALAKELERTFSENGCLMHPLCKGDCEECDVPSKVAEQIMGYSANSEERVNGHTK